MSIAQSPFEPNSAPITANNNARLDGAIENALTGDGDPNYDKSAHNQPGLATRLTYQQKEDLYEGSWLCRRICDAYPSEGTRQWTELTLGSDSKQKMLADFQKYEEKLAPAEAFNQAQTWANIYRGAAIVLHVDDGQSYENPINRDKINSIVEIEVLDPLDIRPNISEGFNPLKPDYYELTGIKTLSMQSQKQLTNTGIPKFHPDRVIRFDGFNLPARSMRRNENWGGSILDNIWTAFSRYESGNNAIAGMLSDYNVFVYALKGLSNLIASSDDKSLVTLRNRLRTLRLTMSNMKGLVIDADGEKAEFVSRNLSGVSDAIAHLKEDLIGASGLPHTAVFGDSAGGLGSTGESEEATWAKMVNQFQEKSFRKKVRYLYELMWLAKDGPSKGKIPDDWNFTFKPLTQESEETKIANRSSQSQTDNTYVSMGVLLKDEVRASRFGGSEFSFETTLDEAAWKKAQEAEQFDPSQFDMGGDPNADPYADPNAPPPDGTDPNAPPPGGGVDPNAAPTEEPEPEPDAKKKKVKQDREDSTNPHRSGFVFVPEMGDRASYWRRDPRRRRAIELPHGVYKLFVPTRPQTLERGELKFAGLTASEMEELDSDRRPDPLSFKKQIGYASYTSDLLRTGMSRSLPFSSGASATLRKHYNVLCNSCNMLDLLRDRARNPSDATDNPRAGLRVIKNRDGIIHSFADVSVKKSGASGKTALSIDILAAAPHNLSLNGIWKPALSGIDNEHTKTGAQLYLPHHRPGTSSTMLEALIKESRSLGLQGRIVCNPLALNRPLFAKAGFHFEGSAMELSPDNAQKFLEMRTRTQQRHDSAQSDLQAALQWQQELNEMEEDLGGFMAGPAPIEPPPTKPKGGKQPKKDSAEPRKRVVTIAGLNLDITHDPGDKRHGRTMTMGYGRVRGSYGHAEDGKSWDVFVGPNPESDKTFKIRQIDPDTLIHDETKYVVGCDTIEQARDLGLIQMGADRFGGIEPVKHAELSTYRQDCSEACGCAIKQKPKRRAVPELDQTLIADHESGDSSSKTPSRSRSKNTRKTAKRSEVLDEESDRETEIPAHPEIKEDSRRIWVDNPKVEHGGFWRTDPRSKAEPRSPAKSFVPKQEFSRLTRVVNGHGEWDSVNQTFFVAAPDGTESIYKVARDQDLDSAAAEILCSDLASSVGVRANTTRLVPSVLESSFKTKGDKAGTLHSIVLGKPVNGIPACQDVTLKLSVWDDEMNKGTILSMVKHPDLARMVALDLFTGNNDRHRNNFFYDASSDQYHAIDMGSAYSDNMTQAFAQMAVGMKRDFKTMSRSEQGNLRVFADTLHRLNEENSIPKLQSRLTHLTKAASSRSSFEESLKMRQADLKTYNRLSKKSLAEAQAHLNQMREGLSPTSQLHIKTQKSLLDRLATIQQSRPGINKVLKIFSPYL